MDKLIIAPTSSKGNDPSQDEINDSIKDQTNAVNLEQKLSPILTNGKKAPSGVEFKSYHDMRAVPQQAIKQDDRRRRKFFLDEQLRFKNGVAFPNMQANNNNYIKGLGKS